MRDRQIEFDSKNYRISEKDVVEYVLERFQDVKLSNRIKNLVEFQAANKYMIMAHNQEELKNLGTIVASYKKTSLSNMLKDYEKHLKIAMAKNPTIKTHTNVIMHIFGYFSKQVSHNEKQLFFDLLEQYRENKIKIGKILLEISIITYRFDNTYLASQTYFLLYSDVLPRILFRSMNERDTVEEFN